jgi:hypothetical protein
VDQEQKGGIELPPQIKRAFLNLQIAILQALISDETGSKEADAYRKMSRLVLSIQRDYEELIGFYKQVKNKKPLSSANEQEHKENMSIKVYQFSRR